VKIKRYLAPDMRRAMRMVRDKQGPDAVILSSKRIDDGIEVLAAVDYDASLLDTKTDESATIESSPSPAAPPDNIALDPATELWGREPALAGMKQEVASLRQLLESQLASLAWNDTARRHPVRAAVTREMTALGLSAQLAKSLAEAADEKDISVAIPAALRMLKERIPILDREILDEPGAVALVGPTGVGKTTTIAKLAARYALKHGTDSLALLTTDGFRIGAQEQLMTFGRILGVPVQLVRDGAELCTSLDTMSDKKLILIDSAGMSQRDKRIHREFTAIRQNSSKVRVLLTLSCTAQAAVLEETVQVFKHLDACGCVLTKVDEAACLGGAISALVRHELPLAYVTDGQDVPEDLHWAGGKRFRLIERALELRNAEPLHDHDEVLAHA